MMPTSKDAIGDLCHFPIQRLAKFSSYHFCAWLQQKGNGQTLQRGKDLQLSKAEQSNQMKEILFKQMVG